MCLAESRIMSPRQRRWRWMFPLQEHQGKDEEAHAHYSQDDDARYESTRY